MTVALYAVLAASSWYLVAWAEITRPLTSWFPLWLDKLASCAACFGFWAGGAVAAGAGWLFGWRYLGLEPRGWQGPLVCALVSVWTTPLLGWMQLGAIKAAARIVTPEE